MIEEYFVDYIMNIKKILKRLFFISIVVPFWALCHVAACISLFTVLLWAPFYYIIKGSLPSIDTVFYFMEFGETVRDKAIDILKIENPFS